MESLAVKYRPHKFSDVCSQNSIVKILTRQLELHEFKNAYLFCGASGCGKTTIARIFANNINGGVGNPIEIDGASNNGVDNVKQIISAAKERALDSEYKIYIIDECHALTSQAWQAFLKCIEEPPRYTIFIFCTTDPQKIPATILNRVMRFNFTRIDSAIIKDRLMLIAKSENYINYDEACEYISKICHGGMRDAISMLDKCASYSTDLAMENTLKSLGNFSYDVFFKLINSVIDGNESEVISIIDEFYYQGNDLKLFVEQFLKFCIDINIYILFNNCNATQFTDSFIPQLNNAVNFNEANKYYGYVIDKLLELKNMIKNDSDIYTTITVGFIKLTRCQ